ncbi:bacillithiol biosynthesis deacetylase BshB1 [Elizabethkingia sp. JS20170427COW]|uniref:bacillithiol biosynthesis deacetylase BshB1 n=1 Tax=Elizabethkingia sp. JS20170427COW TaxID=2583851 RepID=UPI0011106FB9|nr:bacillithiol biosynthesis deacetylase BshB1 [Elizabethkingia sp. JS20170427COW]QCX53400.1 bacillithiol biosynthesis deacetylase BshB1 [Elizabethkingia sp. JS20170427COW]
MINKVDVLAIGAHPDDVELSCAGTIAKLIAEGKKVAIVDLTQGELGTRGTKEIRHAEATKAAEILGVVARENLKMRDGFLVNSEEYQLRIIEKIRKYQPEIVLCNALDDRHPDHAKAAKLTADACFLSGLRMIETSDEGEHQQAWRPKHVFHYIQWRDLKPDFVVDITGFLDKKIESCAAYSSQFYDSNSQEPQTPIATKDFFESITYRAQNLGRQTGVEYAEGFNTARIICLKNFDGII